MSCRLLLALLLPAVWVSPAWGAFPVVAASALTLDTDIADGNLVVTLAAGTAAGNLLVVCVVADDTTASAITPPAGWTELWEHDGVTSRSACAFRLADGGEGATVTFTVTDPIAEDASALALRITGNHASQAPEDGTPAQASSTSPDPPSVTASWGAEDNLWLAVVSASSGFIDTNISANYGGQVLTTGTGTQAVISSVTRNLNTATEDPGTWTLSTGTNWVAQTMVVRPAAAATTAGGLVNSTPLKSLVGGGLVR